MKDRTLNWGIWLLMPDINSREATALTFNRDPGDVEDIERRKDFADCLQLLRRVTRGKRMTPAWFARWAQSADWNIPKALAALAPRPAKALPPADDAEVVRVLEDAAIPGKAQELRSEIERLGFRFTLIDGAHSIHVDDDTVNGRFVELTYNGLAGLCGMPGCERLGQIVRARRASGSGAPPGGQGWPERTAALPPPPESPQAVLATTGQPRTSAAQAPVEPKPIKGETHDQELQALADKVAAELSAKNGRPPGKGEVAYELHDRRLDRRSLDRITRLIRVTWR